MKTSFILTTILISIIVMATFGLLYGLNFWRIQNSGHITTVNILADHDVLYWGIVDPNSTNYHDVVFTNTGNKAVNLSMIVGNWNPIDASLYLTCSWNYTSEIVQPSGSIPIAFILNVSPNIKNITDFSFDITVYGTTTS